MRVLWCLFRSRKRRLKLFDPERLSLDQRRLIVEKYILLSIAQTVSGSLPHPYVDSHHSNARNTYLPTT